MWHKALSIAAVAAAAIAPSSARATEDYFEFWVNPSVETGVGERTTVELETAQRFRASADGGRDTYFFRLWVNRKLSKNATLSGAVEQRWNDNQQERRLHQQLSLRSGILRSRSRLEQRFVDGETRMGVRFRQRLGVDVPLDKRWSLEANAEGFFTLRAGNPGGQTGLTGLRTYVGASHEVSDRLTLSLGYLRAQDIRSGRADRVGHAPLVGIEVSL